MCVLVWQPLGCVQSDLVRWVIGSFTTSYRRESHGKRDTHQNGLNFECLVARSIGPGEEYKEPLIHTVPQLVHN